MNYENMLTCLQANQDNIAHRVNWVPKQWVGLCTNWNGNFHSGSENFELKPFLYQRTAEAAIKPWHPSKEDLEAHNWVIQTVRNSIDFHQRINSKLEDTKVNKKRSCTYYSDGRIFCISELEKIYLRDWCETIIMKCYDSHANHFNDDFVASAERSEDLTNMVLEALKGLGIRKFDYMHGEDWLGLWTKIKEKTVKNQAIEFLPLYSTSSNGMCSENVQGWLGIERCANKKISSSVTEEYKNFAQEASYNSLKLLVPKHSESFLKVLSQKGKFKIHILPYMNNYYIYIDCSKNSKLLCVHTQDQLFHILNLLVREYQISELLAYQSDKLIVDFIEFLIQQNAK